MTLIQRDLKHIWHPCAQMKDYENFPPMVVKSAKGSYIELINGKKIIDAISSWWCKSLGHGHPRLKTAFINQLNCYEHVILANTCQEPLVMLSEKLSSILPALNKIFYAAEGSAAVEIAIKMSLQARKILEGNSPKRRHIMALRHGYHGETMMALSLSDIELYRGMYREWLWPVTFLQNIPYVSHEEDPLWKDCSAYWQVLLEELLPHADTLSAVIVEPIVQGASGMRIYSPDFLHRLRSWTLQNNIHLICDEIMTGCGRTGLPLALQHAHIEPDFVCLGKGLTAGFLPMSAVLTTEPIYQLFYDDYSTKKAFLHSHTFSGNAMAAALALETLNILEDEQIYQKVRDNQNLLRQSFQDIANKTGRLQNIRNLGFIVAADLVLDKAEIKKSEEIRWSYRIFQRAVELGAFLRPLGNTIYWLPPLNIECKTLGELKEITQMAIQNTFG